MAPPHPRTLGRYELLVPLGKGGMAELFVARLTGVAGFSRLVAVKRILPHLADDADFVRMFLDEGRLAAGLTHPNLCQVLELGEDRGELFLAMEYLDGVSWDHLLAALPAAGDQTQRLRLVAGVLLDACAGLHGAHSARGADGAPAPIVHRDISPTNLFVTADGVCKVVDFGIAKLAHGERRTRTGIIKGKLPYMSPEQISAEPVDARSDVFSLSVVLWEALAEAPLFDRDTDYLIWEAITAAPIPPLAPRGYPAQIDAVLAGGLARDREHRFRTAGAMAEALRRAVAPVGGPLAPAEIAAIVRDTCGDLLAARQRRIATAVSSTSPAPSPTTDPLAGPTQVDPPPGAALRARAVRIQRDADPTRLAPAPALAPSRPARRTWIVAAAILLAGAAAVVALVVNRPDRAAPPSAEPSGTGDVTPSTDDVTPSTDDVAAGTDDVVTGTDDVATGGDEAAGGAEATPPDPLVLASDQLAAARGSLTRTKELLTGLGIPGAGSIPAGLGGATATETGRYSIDAEPDATVFIDGHEVGTTPLVRRPLPPGPHRVRLVAPGGRERVLTIELRAGQDLRSGLIRW
ncbi:MAG: protein kinase [Kofleriaceae bacterium]|nr:protein kinase [Kofleriaceae bacterium]